MVALRCGTGAPSARRRGAAPAQQRAPCRGTRALLSCLKTTSAVAMRGATMAGAEGRVALLAGASGLAGGYALAALLEAPDIRRVLAVSRRPLGREHPRLANRIVQFEHLEAQLKGAS